jgi:hypothetical protein
MGKPEGKGTLGRSRHGWVDNIKMDFAETGLGGVDWIALVQDSDKRRTLLTAIMNFHVP